MRIKLFTHTDLDGVGCAVLAYLAFGYENVDVEFCSYDNVNQKVLKFIMSRSLSNSAYYGLIGVAKAIPTEGGIWELFQGGKDLGNFGKKLVPFGEGMQQYAAAVTGLKPSAMLSTGQTIGIRASLNDINTSMNYKNQNGDIGEVVSAINKLRKDIGNMEHATYQINGITYDDGSNISDAISTIVKAARIGRRV